MIPEETYFDGAYYIEKIDGDNSNDLLEMLKTPAENYTISVAGNDLRGQKVVGLNLQSRDWKAIGFKIPRNDNWATTRIQFTAGSDS